MWESVSDGAYPGRFVNCLAADGSHLLVGTMDLGLLVLDTATGAFHEPRLAGARLRRPQRHHRARRPRTGVDRHLRRGPVEVGRGARHPCTAADTGEIGDDWVLASSRAAGGVWFGTFGAGASFAGDDGRWRRLGAADGLPSLDVAAIAWRAPFVYFGTLGAGVCAYWEGADGPQP